MGFAQQYTTAHDAAFRNRVEICVVKVAKQVAGEAQDTRTLIEWRKRGTMAALILSPYSYEGGEAIWLDTFSNAIATNPVIGDTTPTSSITDNDIEFEANAVFSDISGVTGEDLL